MRRKTILVRKGNNSVKNDLIILQPSVLFIMTKFLN